YTRTAPLQSFPTRRSSDLLPREFAILELGLVKERCEPLSKLHLRLTAGQNSQFSGHFALIGVQSAVPGSKQRCVRAKGRSDWLRSEEHTSELQSQSNLVCR